MTDERALACRIVGIVADALDGQEYDHDSCVEMVLSLLADAHREAGGEMFIARDVQPWRFDLGIPVPVGFEAVYKATPPPPASEKETR